MDVQQFRQLLARLGPRIEKEDTHYRKSIPPEVRLAVTLRFLATGDSSLTLQYKLRVARNTVSEIIYHTCGAIISDMIEEFLPLPKRQEEWKEITQKFGSRWNFHNTLGALDGKHIAIRCPPSGGSRYFNYRGFHSVVLLALVDAEYKFLFVGIGSPGSGSDGGIFSHTPLRHAFEGDTLGVPDPQPLPGSEEPVPYFIIGDDAFPLRSWLMKPFSQRGLDPQKRNFNCRLSRARRVAENAFGILTSR